MGKRIAVDLWIVCICAAMAGIAWIYMDEGGNAYGYWQEVRR